MDTGNLEAEYRRKAGLFESLAAEIRHALEIRLKDRGIKFDSIETRIKELASIVRKSENKKIEDPLDALSDVVGARVICLFRSDINEIEATISECFNILSKDDKVSENEDSFGYMSVHFICELPEKYNGPRYDSLKGIKFEIQVRTLCMHAWAAVSHHLDYKTDYDVPRDLKKIFNALSGLFFVADSQFEQAYDARVKSRQVAMGKSSNSSSKIREINFDTFQAYLAEKFPDRQKNTSSDISDLVQEITEFGYGSIEEVDEAVNRVRDAFEKSEKARRPKKLPFFSRVGAVRVSLGIADAKYEDLMAGRARAKVEAAMNASKERATS